MRNETLVEVAETQRQAAQIAEEVKEPLQLMVALKVAGDKADVNVAAGKKFKGALPKIMLPAGGAPQSLLLNLKSE